ncbi:heme exporter protein CcmD [Marinobacter sp. 1Y8]
MAFDSLQQFWEMGGHGPYVWTCYGVFVVAIAGLVIWSRAQRRQVIRREQWQQRLRSHHQAKAAEPSPVSASDLDNETL